MYSLVNTVEATMALVAETAAATEGLKKKLYEKTLQCMAELHVSAEKWQD